MRVTKGRIDIEIHLKKVPYPSSVFKIAESGDFESTFPQGKF